MEKVLITGISGFAGSHLAQYLASQNSYDISGTYLSETSLVNLSEIKKKITLVKLNLIDSQATTELVGKVKPDLIFHLAALPAVGDSYKRPVTTITNNICAQINLLEAVRKNALLQCHILVVSSADVYGKVVKEDLPIDEQTPFMPTNTYAVSKIAQDFLGLQYFLSYNLHIVRARPFNHIGPRQAEGFVVADFARKIALIEKGKMDPMIRVGNLSSRRDFTDVRDMAAAYALLITKGKPGDAYNIGAGKSYMIADILDMLLSFAKIKIKIEADSLLFRRQDAPDRVCDNTKFKKLTGWEPTIPLEQTLQDILEYWRSIV